MCLRHEPVGDGIHTHREETARTVLVEYQKLRSVVAMISSKERDFTLLAPVKTRRSWCKLEYDVDYYHGSDRQTTNIDISTIVSLPPPLVAVTLSLVTLPNTKTHETEVSTSRLG